MRPGSACARLRDQSCDFLGSGGVTVVRERVDTQPGIGKWASMIATRSPAAPSGRRANRHRLPGCPRRKARPHEDMRAPRPSRRRPGGSVPAQHRAWCRCRSRPCGCRLRLRKTCRHGRFEPDRVSSASPADRRISRAPVAARQVQLYRRASAGDGRTLLAVNARNRRPGHRQPVPRGESSAGRASHEVAERVDTRPSPGARHPRGRHVARSPRHVGEPWRHHERRAHRGPATVDRCAGHCATPSAT